MKRQFSMPTIRTRLPDLVALIAIGLLAAAFFWKLIFTNQILPRGDVFSYFYPYWHVRNEALLSGRIPLWNPSLFMGVPFLANSQAGVLYPPNWLLARFDAPQGIKIAIVSHIIWAGWGTYQLSRRTLHLRPLSAFAAGSLFAFGGYMTAQVEHVNQVQGLAWLPWILWLFDQAQETRKSTLWLGMAIALQFLAGHTQSTFITVFVLALWAVVLIIREWRSGRLNQASIPARQRLLGLLKYARWPLTTITLSGLLALGLSAAQLLPTLELAGQSNRSGGLSLREAVSFSLRPEYIGKAFLPSYGPTALFSEYVAFIGILGLMIMFITAVKYRDDNTLRLLAALCGVGLLFAVGAFNPIYWFFVRFVPGFDLFRAPARWLVLWALGSSLMVGYGIERGLYRPEQNTLPATLRRLSPAILIVLLIGLSFLSGLSGEPLPGATVPTGREVALWTASLICILLLLAAIMRVPALQPFHQPLLVGFIILELFAGGRNLPFNQLSSPTAWTSQRPSISTLMASQNSRGPSDRFLSVSNTVFDPGDIRELEAIYSPYLDEQAMAELLTATKQQEIIAPNLSMRWGLSAVDGFDGGLLPLRDYNTFTSQFVADENLTDDGRLRENLAQVPDLMWLRAMSTRWIITDKVFDLWQDGVYYDLQFAAPIDDESILTVGIPQAFEATAIGVVGHLEGGDTIEDGEFAGYMAIQIGTDRVEVYPIVAGSDLSSGLYADTTAHGRAQIAGSFDPTNDDLTEYIAVIEFREPITAEAIRVISADDQPGQIVLRGATLIDQRTGAFLPLNVSPNNALERIYSGDTKIYEYAATRPRFYLTCNVRFVESQDAAFEVLRETGGSVLAIERQGGIDPSCTESLQDQVFVRERSPEFYQVNVRAGSSGVYLIINDSWYPGWTAHVFNSFPERDWHEVPIYRANGMFRAIYLPPGTVSVQLRYPGTNFYTGLVISLTTLLVTAVLLLLPWQASNKRDPEAASDSRATPQPH